jgi:hypothetical protein
MVLSNVYTNYDSPQHEMRCAFLMANENLDLCVFVCLFVCKLLTLQSVTHGYLCLGRTRFLCHAFCILLPCVTLCDVIVVMFVEEYKVYRGCE